LGITGFPTVYFINNGEIAQEYQVGDDKDRLLGYIEDLAQFKNAHPPTPPMPLYKKTIYAWISVAVVASILFLVMMCCSRRSNPIKYSPL
jgi:hypothetical protein